MEPKKVEGFAMTEAGFDLANFEYDTETKQWLEEQSRKHYYPVGGAAVGFAGTNSLIVMQSAHSVELAYDKLNRTSSVPPVFFSKPQNRRQRRAAAKKAARSSNVNGRSVGYRS